VKKILLVVVVLLCLVAAAAGIASYRFGFETEKYYADLQQEVARSGYATLTTESYNRGVFTSTFRTAVEIRPPATPGKGGEEQKGLEPLRFAAVSEVRHGPLPPFRLSDGKWQWKPVLGVIETKIAPSGDAKSGLNEIFQKIPELASITNCITIHLRGDSEGNLTAPAFRRTFSEDVNVRWDGFFLHYTFASNLKGGKGSSTAPLLEVEGKDGFLSVKGAESSGDFHEGASGLSLGEALFRIARLEFASKEKGQEKKFFVENLVMKASDKEAGETIDCLFQIGIEKAGADNVPYGPAEFEMELRKLDVASIQKLQQITREATSKQPAGGSDEIFDALTLARYSSILGAMLKKSPEIEINRLNFATGEGNFAGKMKIAFDGSVTPSLENPLLLLAALTAQAEATVKDRLLEQVLTSIHRNDLDSEGEGLDEAGLQKRAAEKTRAVLDRLMDEKLIVKESDCYRFSAKYHQGQLTLNGRTLPLQELFK